MSAYGTPAEKHKERIATHKMRFLRVMAGYTRIDRVLNETENNEDDNHHSHRRGNLKSYNN
jgi:hypothetical protein